jgi:RHS repeat-associated protein
MGVLKLTYYQREEALEKSSLFVVGALEVNGVSQKNRVRTYRYGFNGMLKDEELKGSGNSYDFGARIYDPRIGRWLSPDPYELLYAPITPYAFALNSPIYFVDADGNVVVDSEGNPVIISDPVKQEDGSYTTTFKFAEGTSEAVKKAFMENGGRAIKSAIQVQTGRDQVEKAIKSKDNIHITINPGESNSKDGHTLGETSIPETKSEYDNETGQSKLSESQDIEIILYEGSIKKEQAKGDDAKDSQRDLISDQGLGSTLAHEIEHAVNPLDRKKLEGQVDLTRKEHKSAKGKGDAAGREYRYKNKYGK